MKGLVDEKINSCAAQYTAHGATAQPFQLSKTAVAKEERLKP